MLSFDWSSFRQSLVIHVTLCDIYVVCQTFWMLRNFVLYISTQSLISGSPPWPRRPLRELYFLPPRSRSSEHSKPYHFPLPSLCRLPVLPASTERPSVRPAIGHVLPHFFISGHFKSADNESAIMTRPDCANLTREKATQPRTDGTRRPASPFKLGELVLPSPMESAIQRCRVSPRAGGGLNAFLARRR